jgi:hypothetical protein
MLDSGASIAKRQLKKKEKRSGFFDCQCGVPHCTSAPCRCDHYNKLHYRNIMKHNFIMSVLAFWVIKPYGITVGTNVLEERIACNFLMVQDCHCAIIKREYGAMVKRY